MEGSMKSTGIVRNIDDLGGFVIPKELRKVLNISDKDPLEIFTKDDTIILRKHQTTCVFCDSSDKLKVFKDKKVCQKCVKEMSKVF